MPRRGKSKQKRTRVASGEEQKAVASGEVREGVADEDWDFSPADHAYFQAVEEIFIKIRGAPLTLGAADWHVARRWRRQGMPLDFVRRSLTEVFARRRERGGAHPKVRLASLRYCAPAVEAAWREYGELAAPGSRAAAPPLEIGPRLAALAAALTARPRLAGGEQLSARLLALAPGEATPSARQPGPSASCSADQVPARRAARAAEDARGLDPQQVEDRLAELDQQMLDGVLAGLDAAARAALAARVEKTLAGLAGSLPAGEIERSRERLLREMARRELGLPVLSLFSPEAQP